MRSKAWIRLAIGLPMFGLAIHPALADEYKISANKLESALYFGETSDGKSKHLILLEMEGNTIHLDGAFVYSTGTEGATFVVVAGDNTPREICIQSSKEKRLSAISVVKTKGVYNIVGEWSRFQNGTVVLSECTFEFVKSFRD